MATLVVFLVLVVVGAAVAVFLARSQWVGRVASLLWGFLAWPVLALSRLASATVDFFLRPEGTRRRIGAARYGLWLVVALLPMLTFFATLVLPKSEFGVLDPGYLLVIGAAFHVFVVFAAYLIVHDDFDVMDGIVDGGERRIAGERTATRPAVIAISVCLVAAYAMAIAYWLAEVKGLALFVSRPHTGFAVADYMLVGLQALPTDFVLNLIDRITGDATGVVFSNTLAAQAYYFLVKGIGSLLLVGLITIAIQEVWQLRRLVNGLAESDARREYLIQRATLAPPIIKRGVLRAALAALNPERQKRLIAAAKDIGVFSLPRTFCYRVESFDPEIQVFGLDQCLEMFRHRSREFDTEQCAATFRAAARALRRGRLAVEPLKKLLRLMTSIVVVRRDTVEITGPLHGMVTGAIRRELDKPRAKEDPALRGFLRDFQSAFIGSSQPAAKPAAAKANGNGNGNGSRNGKAQHHEEVRVTRLPAPADRAALPDSPAPTVH